MSTLTAQSRATHALRERGNLIAIAAQCIHQIRAKDHLLAQIVPTCPEATWQEILTQLATQDARLADAIAETKAITPIPPIPPIPTSDYQPSTIHHPLT